MTLDQFENVLGGISDEFIMEAAPMKRITGKNKRTGLIAAAAAAVLAIAAAVVLMVVKPFEKSSPGSEGSEDPVSMRTALRNPVVKKGTELGEDAAKAYLEENRAGILNALRAFGEDFKDLRFSETGFRGLRLGEKKNEIDLSFREYLMYDGEKLVGTETLWLDPEDGQIHGTPAWGGPWMEAFGEWIRAHADEKPLVFYNGPAMYLMTPSGAVTTRGESVADKLPDYDKDADYYNAFFDETIVIAP